MKIFNLIMATLIASAGALIMIHGFALAMCLIHFTAVYYIVDGVIYLSEAYLFALLLSTTAFLVFCIHLGLNELKEKKDGDEQQTADDANDV